MNNILFGGYDPQRQRAFVYYETLAGGAGAHPDADGAHAIHTHMTNTRNTPIEALESAYPVRVLEYRIAERTGGAGAAARRRRHRAQLSVPDRDDANAADRAATARPLRTARAASQASAGRTACTSTARWTPKWAKA
jgi:hypothetical protein